MRHTLLCSATLFSALALQAKQSADSGSIISDLIGLPPSVNLKVYPDQPHQLSASELNALLGAAHDEIRKMGQMAEDQYAALLREKEKSTNVWAMHDAPIYIPKDKAFNLLDPSLNT